MKHKEELMNSSKQHLSNPPLPGVSAMSLYVPQFRVDLEKWCEWTGSSWDKVKAVVGSSFRVP